MADAKRDGNFVPSMLGVSSVDSITPIALKVDPTTGRLLVDSTGGSGYTNLTQFVSQTPWRVFYSDGAGDVQELALGASGTVLASAGAASVPTWNSVGAGTVTATGGSLTANSIVLGAGTTDTKVVAGIVTDGISQLALGVNTTTLGKIKLFGNTSGDVTLQPNAVAGTGIVHTLPATAGVLVNRVTTGSGVSASNTDGALAFTLGAITPTTVNGNTFTTGSSTYTGTAAQTYTFPATSATIARIDAANTFVGTQTMGALIATTLNGNTFTTGTYTLTGTAAKTLSFTNTLTLSGTDSTTMTFPTTSKTIAANDGSNMTLASQAIGDIITASSTTALSRLADVATGQVLVSGGVGVAPAYSANPQVTTLELGATDTTLARVAAGVISVEGETLNGYATTATATATTTLTIADKLNQFFTGTLTQTVKLPTTSVIVGQPYVITNNSTGLVTVQSSGANTIVILGTGMTATFTAIVATPTTAANWGYSIITGIDIDNAVTASANAATINLAYVTNTVTNNSAATLTITLPTAGAISGERRIVRVLDFSAVAQTITWVNTENSTVTAPVTSNASTTLPITAGFQYNSGTSKWRCVASA